MPLLNMHEYPAVQEPSYRDNIFLIKSRLHQIARHPNKYSRKKLVQQIYYLEWLVEDLGRETY